MSLFDPPGGVAFSYLVIIKSMTHTPELTLPQVIYRTLLYELYFLHHEVGNNVFCRCIVPNFINDEPFKYKFVCTTIQSVLALNPWPPPQGEG